MENRCEPVVSVVLPSYNSARYIANAIESVINQTYPFWELIVINEFGSSDDTAKIVGKYMASDGRIRLYQNDKKLGLAESLNRGIHLARGRYIARMDADDSSYVDRFKKQVCYLDRHQDIAVCGTWQKHYGKREWIHTPPEDAEKCMSILLFDCNLCHSTVMMRKDVLESNNLFYKKDSVVEDFELWSRVIEYGKIANVPEVLGKYFESDDNITFSKMEQINKESAEIVKNSLKHYLGVTVNNEELPFLMEYKYPLAELSGIKKLYKKRVLKRLIHKIYLANIEKNMFGDNIMKHVLHYLWIRETTGEIGFNSEIEDYKHFSDIF